MALLTLHRKFGFDKHLPLKQLDDELWQLFGVCRDIFICYDGICARYMVIIDHWYEDIWICWAMVGGRVASSSRNLDAGAKDNCLDKTNIISAFQI